VRTTPLLGRWWGRSGPASAARRFCIRFTLLVVVAFTVLSLLPDEDFSPYLRMLAASAAACLDLPGLELTRDGTLIVVNGFAIRVEAQCSAVYEAALLSAAIAASPVSLLSRLAGIAAGVTALLVVNVIRIASLALIGALAPAWFLHAHLFVWQALLVATVTACWLAWLARAGEATAS
jgi:exosortase H (IPTLxxWG-CTERM-specific)